MHARMHTHTHPHLPKLVSDLQGIAVGLVVGLLPCLDLLKVLSEELLQGTHNPSAARGGGLGCGHESGWGGVRGER